MTPREQQWADAIAADLRENCDEATFRADPLAAIKAAHERRQAFLAEMQQGHTERAQIAHRMLCAVVYANVRRRAEIQRFIDHEAERAAADYRRRLFQL